MNRSGTNYRHCMVGLIVLVSLAGPVATRAAEIKFEIRRIGRFRGEACGVADFNNDGRLDIIAGSFWYEAPDWKPRQFRFLESMLDPQGNIHTVDSSGKGYYDDFTNIPLDIDKDGLNDVVTCSWFSKRFDWYRNSGDRDITWRMTKSDEGVNFECGDLCDINGDGKELEILPHCQDTRWYEIGRMNLVVRSVSSRELNYGGGVGDINGDGRPDIVRPDAWYEAPADLRNGKWTEHPLAVGSIEQGKSEHTPQILVYDVDSDGLNDLVTSSAHQYGIFWYRQVRHNSNIAFEQNLIDKSWSQAHSLALADLDNDGDLDLVTGKRFYAHNGTDPGEEDPLGVYWYELDRRQAIKWTRHTISYGDGIGSGLSIPVVDIDRDGDLDIVVTGKWGGPVLFENKLKSQ